jgi:uncharacterized LabA/DUF88 family protein
MAEKVALLLDGGFVQKLLRKQINSTINAGHVESLSKKLLAHQFAKDYALYRAFYYDCPPLSRTVRNPISKATLNFDATTVAANQRRLLNDIELKPNFAVRRGELLFHGWKLKKSAERALSKSTFTIADTHIQPFLQQKGADQRITLDLVGLAEKRLVNAVILVICDSDFVPVMKAVRREGLQVILFAFDHPVKPNLKQHSDFVIPASDISIPP